MRTMRAGLPTAILVASIGCNAGDELAKGSDADATIDLVRTQDRAPTWAIRYGDEFWRHAAADAGSTAGLSDELNIGDVVDRVSHAIERPGASELPRAVSTTYTASFDGRGLRFSPHRPGRARAKLTPPTLSVTEDPATELQVRTSRVALGERELYRAEQVVPWSALGNTAQGLLDASAGLVEHHEARQGGVELTWVVRDRGDLDGDLVVDVAVDGLTLAGQTAGGIHFADGTGLPRVRIGTAELVDARGERWPVSAETVSGGIRWRVDAGILRTATFPVALDPIVGPEFGLDATFTSNVDASESEPSATASSTGYLVVWSDQRTFATTNQDIYGARVSTTGVILDPSGIAIATGPHQQHAPTVASNGTDFMVAWSDYDRTIDTDDIYGVRVTAAGVAQTSFAITTAANEQLVGGIASNGTDYFVTWRDARSYATNLWDIYGARITAAGVVQDANGFAIAIGPTKQEEPSVASNGSTYLVAWRHWVSTAEPANGNGNWDIHGARISGGGVNLDPSDLVISSAVNGEDHPAVASNGTDYLVAWADSRNDPDYYCGFCETWINTNIYGSRVTAAGVVGANVALSMRTEPEYRPSVASNRTDYLVAWTAENTTAGAYHLDVIYGARVLASGALQDTTAIPIATAVGRQDQRPAIASVGSAYLVAWADNRDTARPGNYDIFGARVTAAGTVQDPSGLVISAIATTPMPNAQATPSVASNGTSYLIVWNDTRNLLGLGQASAGIYGTRVSAAGAIQDPAGIAILANSTPDITAVASNGTNYLVVWDETTWDGNIRGARISAAGTVLDTPSLLITSNADDQHRPSVASNGTDYFVAWANWNSFSSTGSDIYGTRISGAGVVATPSGIAIARTAAQERDVAVASNRTDYLLAWSQTNTTDEDIYGARVTAAGTVVDTTAFAISTAASFQLRPSAASNGSSYLVAWADLRTAAATDFDIYAARIVTAGAVQVTGLAISTALTSQVNASVATNGTDYLVVWADYRLGAPTSPDLRATPITAAGVVQDTTGIVISSGGKVEELPRVAGNASDSKFLIAYQSDDRLAARLFGGNTVNLCGNATLDVGETCDDGATTSGDGCSSICTIESGYTCSGTPSTCSDINECMTANGGCAQTCTNTVGSRLCSCTAGYVLAGDAHSCNDINECATNNGGCADVCTNAPGSRTCSCHSGYAIGTDGVTCEDVDECATSNGGCDQICTDMIGSRTCSCQPGYVLTASGHDCADIDECATNNGGCAQACTDTDGSHTCSCSPGYVLSADGLGCDDTNGCTTSNGGCSEHATCSVTPAGVTCSCNDGFSGDGITCGAEEPPPKGGGCQTSSGDASLLLGLGLCAALRRRRRR